MKQITLAARAASFAALAGTLACQGGGLDSAQSAPLETDDQKASYAIGLQVGGSLAPAGDMIQMTSFLRGLQDAMAERDPAVDPADLQMVMQAFGQRVEERQQTERAATGTKNQEEGAAFLATNGAKDGVTTTASGLQYEVMRAGDGPLPAPTDRVTIHYRGTLIDGTEFDTSYDGEPATFNVGGVIQGFSEGLLLMPVGSQYRLVIPGELAYGEGGSGAQIGPHATLIFEVEMLEIAQ